MHLVDANVLLYAVNPASAHHTVARRWLDRSLSESEPVGFAWTVLLAFLRLATSASVFPRPLATADAVSTVRDWLSQPTALVVEPTVRHLDVLAGLLAESGTAGNLVADAHLAALAVEYGAALVSFDADFGRYAGLRWERPG